MLFAGSNKATSSLRVLLLDRQSPPEVTTPLPVVPDLRVSTVTSASVQLFKDVGAWEDIAPPRSAAFHHMQVANPLRCHASLSSLPKNHKGLIITLLMKRQAALE